MSKRQDFSREQSTSNGDKIRLGDYTLGQTLGEGEFGKVKIGWKKSSSSQVAVKIIRREKLDTAGRLAKVHREISILKQLNHPNIVSLHEMIETRNTIGMVLEYASGGELFDYILQQRYLKDEKARRLFAQLVSGVGYLHRNGIIHRDLKLENLLLDSNRNIIITDFGFANTFDPTGASDVEDRDTAYQMKFGNVVDLDKTGLPSEKGYKHSDMMSTSCGSPCYAAPELVVSDGLYSGRKVDVWSCGVILYAMLAGYLPFDDDPDNPEGDNINLLYKYICQTPLIFPDYVTPHARDILKRILVPDPKNRADLFEVARHSWLSDYADLVEAITSNVKLSPEEYHRTKALQLPIYEFTHPRGKVEPISLARTNSDRFTYKPRQTSENYSGAQLKLHGAEEQKEIASGSPKDQKRRTVQVEYVAPKSQQDTTIAQGQGQTSEALKETSPNLKTRFISKVPAENREAGSKPPRTDVPASLLPPPSISIPKIRNRAPRAASEQPPKQNRLVAAEQAPPPPERIIASKQNASKQDRIRPSDLAKDPYRPGTVSESNMFGSKRETTRPKSARLPPSRGSYGQPSEAEVQKTSAQGQISGPTASASKERTPSGHLIMPPSVESSNQTQKPSRGHKRASTLSNLSDKLLTRANSISRRGKGQTKTDRSHPPTSMRHDAEDMAQARQSNDSARRSFGFSRTPGKLLPGKHKRFNDAYEAKNSSSSGASRRVMEFFRLRR